MTAPGFLDRGREAFRRRRWGDAVTDLAAAETESPLAPADYELLVTSRFLVDDGSGIIQNWEAAHQVFLARGDVERAVRCAFWLAMNLGDRGETARAAGWVARGVRLLDDNALDSLERGFLLIPPSIGAAVAGDIGTALAMHDEAISIGERFKSRDLVVLARHGRGRILLRSGRTTEGLALIDETMVALSSGDISPAFVGVIYCSVIAALHEVYDIGRAHEWTAALQRWCDSQQDVGQFRGSCMVYRAELLQLRGQWSGALQESTEACRRFIGPPAHPAAGSAFYQAGEVHRVAGRFADAEEAYRQAGEFGRSPQPGLALLRLAEGAVGVADAAIRRAIAEPADPVGRAGILPAYVEIALAAGDVPAAREACRELAVIARDLGSEYLRAAAAQATAATLLAGGETQAALSALRGALGSWTHLGAPYQQALTRVLLGLACREMGDEEAAVTEINAARAALVALGALADVARVDRLASAPTPGRVGGLTGREVELLGLLATGKTNRDIAAALFISEKTVARHVSNIFNKLGVSSRAAATAYAYQHDLA